MKRIITEITNLKTGLPPGIFVKFASSRVNMMKIMIVGPSGTPYEYGLFEFDLWCGPDYPHSSPNMLFKTTNGGRVRFNPNLYQDGKGKTSDA
jgi:baculoviral IAP repeat-containing protein 6